MKHQLDFSTAYNQFYIYDKDGEGDTASNKFWTNEAYDDRLAVETGVLGVGIETYGSVKGEIEILTAENTSVNFEQFDHIVEAGIDIKSGVIQVINCPNSNVELEVKVIPGKYSVRVYSSNLASAEEEEGDDFYRIEIWPGIEIERKVLKRY